MSEDTRVGAGYRRSWVSLATERGIEALIRLCGISAVILVGGIFLFVFREAFPVLTSPQFSLPEFLFSVEWYPTSATDIRYGVLAMIAGAFLLHAIPDDYADKLIGRFNKVPMPVYIALFFVFVIIYGYFKSSEPVMPIYLQF